MKVDVTTFGAPLRQAQRLAAEAVAAGFDGLVVTEGARTAFLTCAAAALAVDLDLATGIAVAFPRSPMVTAQLAWELADVTGGRFRLGLGTQVRAHVERRFGSPFEHPGPRLRDYVGAVRACFAAFRGEAPLDFHGEYHQLTLLNPSWSPGPIAVPDPPIDVAAVNPWMLRMAGEVADGVHVHPLNNRRILTELIHPNLVAGASAAGRDPASLHVTVPVLTAVGRSDQERSRWREVARAQVAFYGSTPNYARLFEHLGFEGTTQQLRVHQRAGDVASMTAVIDDEILDQLVVDATFDELPRVLVDRYAGVADRLVLYFAAAAWVEEPEVLARWGAVAEETRRLVAKASPPT